VIGGIGLFVLFECCLREKLQLAVCGTSRKQMVLCYQHDEGGEEPFAWRGVVSFPIRWKQLGSENPKYWRAFGCNGKEITHTELANALKHKTEFTKTEWMALGFTSDDIPKDDDPECFWCCCICIPTPCCLYSCLFGYLRDVFCNTMSSNSAQTLWTTHFIKSGDFYYAPVDPACRDDPLPGPENALPRIRNALRKAQKESEAANNIEKKEEQSAADADIGGFSGFSASSADGADTEEEKARKNVLAIPVAVRMPLAKHPNWGAMTWIERLQLLNETMPSGGKDGAGMGTDMSDGTGACL